MFGSDGGTAKQPRTLLMRGIDLLSRREHSRLELFRKLSRTLQEDETIDDVNEALDTLQAEGYLSNERYAESRVRSRSQRYGNARLAQELRMSGVDDESIREALSQSGSELERARSVWSRKFSSAPQDARERAKQIRFLASRGFSFDVISRVIEGAEEDA